MEKPRYLRQRALKGETLVGTWVSLPSPAVVELIGDAGFDFVTIEGEHAAFSRSQIEDLVRAADAAELPSIVRVPQDSWISFALDAGAGGVMVPRVDTAAQAQAIVDQARFPPDGRRGIGAGRATRYGMSISPYLAGANQGVIVILMIESVEGVQNIHEILAVPGIDVIFIGTGDLGLSIAHANGLDLNIDEAISRVVTACRDSGSTVGMMATDLETFAKWKSRGMTFMMVGLDVMMLGKALHELQKQAREIG